MAKAEDKCGCKSRLRAHWPTTRRASFENIDKGNFPLIVARVDGVIHDVTSTQPGDKIQTNAPLGALPRQNARPILKTEIAEHDRAFLREGLPVQLKFNAFPYQRYELIRGTLQYISPATKPSAQIKQPVYEGRIPLEPGPVQGGRDRLSDEEWDDGGCRDRSLEAALDRFGAGSVQTDWWMKPTRSFDRRSMRSGIVHILSMHTVEITVQRWVN